MNEIPLKTTCNACGGEGVLATGKIFTFAGREHPDKETSPFIEFVASGKW
ncbi:MAG: hypothetical protein IMZ73_10380 [Chloroflexi bacterium]|nr:hypothetical protein [Chloroflexota bacterium]